jgi:hypothetical protein
LTETADRGVSIIMLTRFRPVCKTATGHAPASWRRVQIKREG